MNNAPAGLRPATVSDLPSISAIYGHAVRESVATFDIEDPPLDYWRAKVTSGDRGDHLVVVEDAAAVVGFAYSTAFRPRPAYAQTRETSIYLAPEALGRGLGRLTYAHLLSLLRMDGMHCAVAVIAQPNPASTALHESLGYQLIGTLREVGRKFGRWVDTSWYQLLLERP